MSKLTLEREKMSAPPILEPAIYVADLAAYNSAILHGKWISLKDKTRDEVYAEIEALLAEGTVRFGGETLSAKHEEFAIHDYEGFGPIRISEYESIDDVLAHVERMEDDEQKYFAWIKAGAPDDEFDSSQVYGPYANEEDIAYEALDDVIGTETLSDWLQSKGMPETLALTIKLDAEDYVFSMRCNTGASVVELDGDHYLVDT
jgi:antirestriction protein